MFGLPKPHFRLTAEKIADPGETTLPETNALALFDKELLSLSQQIARIFALHATGHCELRGHIGNAFQNGPLYVRQIPAVVGDMKMLSIRRCPKDPQAESNGFLSWFHACAWKKLLVTFVALPVRAGSGVAAGNADGG